ncbi:MAG: IS30 family transposase, partial [Candidatus Cryptobacteroides sp.]
AIARQINVSPSTVSREIRNHRRIANALNAKVYFADSYASWQKGAIENANKLIRQYIPKGTDFDLITDDFIHSVQLKINRRPREKLNFSTPKDEFFKFLS